MFAGPDQLLLSPGEGRVTVDYFSGAEFSVRYVHGGVKLGENLMSQLDRVCYKFKGNPGLLKIITTNCKHLL